MDLTFDGAFHVVKSRIMTAARLLTKTYLTNHNISTLMRQMFASIGVAWSRSLTYGSFTSVR